MGSPSPPFLSNWLREKNVSQNLRPDCKEQYLPNAVLITYVVLSQSFDCIAPTHFYIIWFFNLLTLSVPDVTPGCFSIFCFYFNHWFCKDDLTFPRHINIQITNMTHGCKDSDKVYWNKKLKISHVETFPNNQ